MFYYEKELKEAQKSLLKIINLNKKIYELERIESRQKEKREKRVNIHELIMLFILKILFIRRKLFG